ncbi:MAG: hypothetical protein ACJ779_04225 [Chloroflexota bacterium]
MEIRSLLDPGEEIEQEVSFGGRTLAVTSHRLALFEADRIALAIPIERVWRIQLDIERARPGSLVIVPDEVIDHPEVLTFGVEDVEEVSDLLVSVGRRLSEMS